MASDSGKTDIESQPLKSQDLTPFQVNVLVINKRGEVVP